MWPKILIELIPHISRLVPTAEKFFASRGATDEATQQAIASLRAELAATAGTHASLYRQMNEQTTRIAQAADDAAATRVLVSDVESRLLRLEKRSQLNSGILIALFVMALGMTIAFSIQLLNLHH